MIKKRFNESYSCTKNKIMREYNSMKYIIHAWTNIVVSSIVNLERCEDVINKIDT